MHMLEKLISIFAPHVCVGCGVEQDALLCDSCFSQLKRIPSRCYRCKAATRDYAVCTTCTAKTPLRAVYVLTVYDDTAKELVHVAKYERAQQGFAEIGKAMLHIASLPRNTVLIPVPTASSRVRQRGYDHTRDLTKYIARSTRLPYSFLVRRAGQAHQVGSTRAQRFAHMRNQFYIRGGQPLKGKRILLVDDVITTGATIEAAARACKQAGAKRVDAIVFAQAV